MKKLRAESISSWGLEVLLYFLHAICRLRLCLKSKREEGWLLPLGWTVMKSHWCIVSLIFPAHGCSWTWRKKGKEKGFCESAWSANRQENCKILANWKYQMPLILLIPWEFFASFPAPDCTTSISWLNKSCRLLRSCLQALSPVWLLSSWGTCCVFLWMLLTSPSNTLPECHKNTLLERIKYMYCNVGMVAQIFAGLCLF